ncbi:type II toxin-antitoxin system PemK/MazF family toxin [Thermoactinospora rubra]|uniref:type II toxin-antitoxin system PemK/MazF family toxin n=1 Tax=Thermoactinospora rubra TaxID=1088767 RepID=UPI000A104FD0|nr:type II toxin-antitoxin system PemK/MazF family toxin [Thermoactinospora rubra]
MRTPGEFQDHLTGDIWWAEQGSPDGNVQGYPRPVLVVSADELHRISRGALAWVLPITSRKRGWAGHVRIEACASTGLDVASYAMCEQLRVFNARDWLLRRMGAAPEEVMQAVERAIIRIGGLRTV